MKKTEKSKGGKDFPGTPVRQLKIEFAIFQNYGPHLCIARGEDTPASNAQACIILPEQAFQQSLSPADSGLENQTQ